MLSITCSFLLDLASQALGASADAFITQHARNDFVNPDFTAEIEGEAELALLSRFLHSRSCRSRPSLGISEPCSR